MTDAAPRRPAGRRVSWHRRATRPVQLWMVALVVLGVVHRWVPASTWVIVHVFTLGLLTNSILVWGQHFVESLLHTRPGEAARRVQGRRSLLLNGGVGAPGAAVIGGSSAGGVAAAAVRSVASAGA